MLGADAYTAAVLTARKLLMHIAVDLDADPNKQFICYIEYLLENHYVAPRGAQWVNSIRNKGNEVNHEIKLMTKEDALALLDFLENIVRSNYEFPARVTALDND